MSYKQALLSFGFLAVAAGCNGGAPVTLSTRTGQPVTPAAAGRSTDALAVGDGIEVTRVQMVIRDIKFEREGALEETEITVGPFLLDLSGAELEGGVSQVFETTVPPGRYDELGFVIHRLEDADRSNPEFAALAGKDASILLTGTIDGQPFEFASRLNEEQKLASSIDIVEGPNNVTLNIDPTSWFKDAAGNRLDPRQESSRDLIEDNLESSIDAFEDDDSDGDDDDHDPTDDNGVDVNDDP